MTGHKVSRRTWADLNGRVTLLEDTLRDVWLWSSRESDNLDLLREILMRADREHEVRSELDSLLASIPQGGPNRQLTV